jgi:hypothetical protein
MHSGCFLRWRKPAVHCLALAVLNGVFPTRVAAQSTNLYSTGFERSEGFDADLTLIGQDNWTGTDFNGNGFVTNAFANGAGGQPFGQQQAFVGIYPLTNTQGTLNVWEPLDFDPVAANEPIVSFSVTMAVYDSTVARPNRDCFRWSVYNTNNGGTRLFTLDFDNTTLNINYELDDNVFVWTGFNFENAGSTNGQYDLFVTMNFADNVWSAWLNDVQIVDSKTITTKGSALNLGDVDAVWVNDTLGQPGNNFMVFDNYTVTAEPYPFQLEAVLRLGNGAFLLRLTGEPGRQYAIDATSDFVDWFALKTNSAAADGTFDFLDDTATNYSSSFYRARLVP